VTKRRREKEGMKSATSQFAREKENPTFKTKGKPKWGSGQMVL